MKLGSANLRIRRHHCSTCPESTRPGQPLSILLISIGGALTCAPDRPLPARLSTADWRVPWLPNPFYPPAPARCDLEIGAALSMLAAYDYPTALAIDQDRIEDVRADNMLGMIPPGV